MTPSSDGGGGNLNAEHPTAPPPRSSPRLHNFSIPALRWGAQRFLRCKSPVTASTSDRHHHKPQRNHEDETQPSAAVKSPWNLRIRRLRSSGNAPPPPPPQCQAGDMNRSDSAANKSPSPEDKSEEEKGLGKAKFAVELTGEEIEEDFLRMKGSRPQRRPKKRARIVQKKLDRLFPGLWLDEITTDSYKTND